MSFNWSSIDGKILRYHVQEMRTNIENLYGKSNKQTPTFTTDVSSSVLKSNYDEIRSVLTALEENASDKVAGYMTDKANYFGGYNSVDNVTVRTALYSSNYASANSNVTTCTSDNQSWYNMNYLADHGPSSDTV